VRLLRRVRDVFPRGGGKGIEGEVGELGRGGRLRGGPRGKRRHEQRSPER
jgi:hypothetical protein